MGATPSWNGVEARQASTTSRLSQGPKLMKRLGRIRCTALTPCSPLGSVHWETVPRDAEPFSP
jgi:hypothetical protein